MWSALDRTRRLLFGAATPPSAALDAPADDGIRAEAAAEPPRETIIAIGRPEFDRLGVALRTVLGPGTARPDTPARLEAALAQAIAGLGASGRTLVARRPAGL